MFQSDNLSATGTDDCDEELCSSDTESEQTNTTVSSSALATVAVECVESHTDGKTKLTIQTKKSYCSLT